jgi:hypothetical protein
VTMQFYQNGKVEAQKELRRRTDLESGNGTLIYTSRTSEITVYLSYD